MRNVYRDELKPYYEGKVCTKIRAIDNDVTELERYNVTNSVKMHELARKLRLHAQSVTFSFRIISKRYRLVDMIK